MSKLLNLVDNEVDELDKTSNDLLEGVDKSVMIISGSLDEKSFEAETERYMALRKQYHRLNVRKEYIQFDI
jgi:hypothetical protein